jgi:hypothetical protein
VELTFGNGAVTEETRRDRLVAAHLVGSGASQIDSGSLPRSTGHARALFMMIKVAR